VTDISRNKQKKLSCRKVNNKFSSVFEQAGSWGGRVGLDGAWLEVTKKLCAIVGLAKVLLAKNFQGYGLIPVSI